MSNCKAGRRGFRRWVATACAVCFILSVVTFVRHQKEIRKRRMAAMTQAGTEADIAVAEIEKQVGVFKQQAHDLADLLTRGELKYSKVEGSLSARITKAYADGQPLFAMGVALEPGVYKNGKVKEGDATLDDLQSWYCFISPRDQKLKVLPKKYVYSERGKKKTEWYTAAVEKKVAVWQEPKFGSTAGEYIAGYSVPFYLTPEKKTVAGVVTANYSVRELKSIMRDRDIWGQGYGMIFSQGGKLIFHPDEDLLCRQLVGNDEGRVGDHPDLEFLNRLARERKSIKRIRSYINRGMELWVCVRQIPGTDWDLAVVFVKAELKLFHGVAFHFLVLSVLGFVLSLLYLLVIRDAKADAQVWCFAVGVTVVFVVATSILWKIAYETPRPTDQERRALKTRQDICALKSACDKQAVNMRQDKPVYIPTGVYVKSISFSGPNEVSVTGFVWQKYLNCPAKAGGRPSKTAANKGVTLLCGMRGLDNDYANTQTHGCVMPEANESSITFLESSADYRHVDPVSGQGTIGWYFKMNLRQPFDYERYPFDPQDVWIRLHHTDFNRNVVLVPDLDAYDVIYESALPGLGSTDFVLPGWQLSGCHFSYRLNSYNTNFGIDNYVGQKRFPELYYNVSIRRDFMDPFISTITPVLMIIIILFIVMMMTSVREDTAAIGFSVFAVLGIIAGLLFSVTFWHAGMRQQFPVTGISFFECFYLVCYCMIAYVSINSSLLATKRYISIIDSRDNLYPKALFLPVAAGAILLITLFRLF